MNRLAEIAHHEDMDPKIEPNWLSQIGEQFDRPYMQQLRSFLLEQKQLGKQIYPPGSLWFEAFNRTPFDQVKVVILGQDPYHGPDQAHGLCFSVLPCLLYTSDAADD